jgi:hypothetical protein
LNNSFQKKLYKKELKTLGKLQKVIIEKSFMREFLEGNFIIFGFKEIFNFE